MRLKWVLWVAGAAGLLLVMVPGIDLTVSGWFYGGGRFGFIWRQQPVAEFLHESIQILSRVLGAVLVVGFLYTAARSKSLWGLTSRPWLFLAAALVVGPGLVANVVLKDNWGRARPLHVKEFGGKMTFTPPLVVSGQCNTNCSFVAGDAAIAFNLHSFAYVVRRGRRRLFLIGGIGIGLAAGLLRIGMGGHFFSDVLFAGAFMLVTAALLHLLIFGRRSTEDFWKSVAGTDRRPEADPQQAHGTR